MVFCSQRNVSRRLLPAAPDDSHLPEGIFWQLAGGARKLTHWLHSRPLRVCYSKQRGKVRTRLRGLLDTVDIKRARSKLRR